MQAIYSQAGYILRHPNVKSDAEKQAAGLAGALRAYRAIQRFDPSAQYPVLDNLLSLQKHGKLQQYVTQQSKCKKLDFWHGREAKGASIAPFLIAIVQ